MQLFKLPVVVLVFIVIKCRAVIPIATSSPDERSSSVVEDLVKIVKSCYGDKIGYGVGFAGNLPDTFIRTLSVRHLIPVVLIDDTKKLYKWDSAVESVNRRINHAVEVRWFRHKLSVFIVEASSWEQLSEFVFPNIQSSIWSNKMASYFILDRSPGCVNTQDFLLEAFRFGLHYSKVMCYHYRSEKIIVTYSPFTDKAPLSWKRHFNSSNNYPFFSFSRKYEAHEAICVDLDFDKTKDLTGATILVEGVPPGTNSRLARTLREYQLWSERDRVLSTIYRAVNITPDFTGDERWYMCMSQIEMNGISTFLPDPSFVCSITYPREQIGKVLVSHFRTRDSQWNTIRSAIDVYSGLGLGVVYFIAPFIFKLFARQPLVSAILNLIRITCNMDFTHLRHNNSPRIYLTTVLFVAVTVQGMYQGYLACLLTTRIPRRNVETMADVAEFGYRKIYGLDSERVTIENPELEKLFENVYDVYHCIEYVKRDPLAVCFWAATVALRDLAQEFDLYVSEPVASMYEAYTIKENWEFQHPINVIIGRLAEADLLRLREVPCSPTRLANLRLTNSRSNLYINNNNFEKINLRELSFAFGILSIGLACATFTFIVELAIRYKCGIVRRQIVNGHV